MTQILSEDQGDGYGSPLEINWLLQVKGGENGFN
jgi:hypothetical protein